MSRALALPAIACLVLAVVLGIWGWGQRDEARARIVPEPTTVEEGGFFGDRPLDDVDRSAQACAALRAASRLEVPSPEALGIDGPVPSTAVTGGSGTSPVLGYALQSVLTPDLVVGVPELDRLDVIVAISDEARAIDAALLSGADITADPEVVRTATALGDAIAPTC